MTNTTESSGPNISKASLPFHTTIVTSPDSKSAQAAFNEPLDPSSLPPIFVDPNGAATTTTTNNVNIYLTSDPFDTHVGSSGIKLAALEFADTTSQTSYLLT
jgi:hypothetical protein